MRKLAPFLLLLLTTCVEPYPLPKLEANSQILIVDAFLNATANEVSVRLSRSVNLNDEVGSTPQQAATVVVEQEGGGSITLFEQQPGLYYAPIASDLTKRYRLRVEANGERYLSSFETVYSTPTIDSLTWTPKEDGISVNVNAHDPTGQSKYYFWTYEETWEYRAAFQSNFKFENGNYIYRLPEEDIYKCYMDRSSNEIMIGTTNRLAEDIISQFSVVTLPLRSEKLNYNYSIHVKQITISQSAYDFWQQLKRNTESLGTLFDPQPSQITGNMSAENGSGQVIGYFYASTLAQERLTLTLEDLPDAYQFIQDIGLCEEDTVFLNELPQFQPKTYNLIVGVYNTFGSLIGFRYSTHPCTDCILRGGRREKPSFFP